ncbi:MAG: peptidase S10 [Acidobacteria bacterium]|nr:MAG: peptidase S10 [Acidobacteriota bacterium]
MPNRNFLARAVGLALGAALVAWLPAAAQGRQRTPEADSTSSPFMFETAATDPPPVVTHHTITMDGKVLHYTATVGKLPVPDDAGKIEGHLFYIAYTLDNPDPAHPRPVTFSYNGGPGADSVWVDIGGFGPRRAALGDDAQISPPPYTMVDNHQTWLDASDLVFIDAMGTGYSRATSLANLKKAASVSGDLQAFSEFIRLWLYDNNRLNSPVILAGESYGTFRSAGLAGTLLQHHIAASGVVLLSSVLNLMTLSPSMSNDRPYWLALPTLTAIAWYHKKLPADLEKEPLPQVVTAAEQWASTKYEHYLDEGDTLQGAERQQALSEMARFTGLPAEFLNANNLRIGTSQFDTRLLQEQGLVVGRYDGEMTEPVRTPGSPFQMGDPSSNINTPYDHEFINYLRNELDYKTTLEYGDRNAGGAGNPGWNYELGRDWFGTADVTPLLARAFEQVPSMRLMLCEGYFDQATPMFEATNSMKHLFITPAEQSHISIEHYGAGHMLYTHRASRVKLHQDFVNFVHSLPGEH